jgi:carboxyl-terminal processing protease
MTIRRKALVLLFAFALILGGSFVVTRHTKALGDASPFDEMGKVLEVISLVKMQYVDPVDPSDLIRAYVDSGSINGMLFEALDDPYTRYLDQAAFKQMQIDTTGEFAGIGITVGMRDDRLTIVAPIPNTPGSRAGLLGGDRITHIDGRSTEFMSMDEAVSLMRGKPDTEVILTIERGAENPAVFDVKIIRATIKAFSVSGTTVMREDKWPVSIPVGYVRLIQFSERSASELQEAVNSLWEQQVKGIIVDLRNNPGGLLTSAIEVASLFLNGGPVVHIVGRGDEKQTINARRGPVFDIPLVVMVNQYSASASEIVSGALQDRGKATLVGATTFGKGLVQVVVPMRDGSALSLTNSRYQTAGGRFIHETGIVPDVEFILSEDEMMQLATRDDGNPDAADRQLLKALEILQELIRADAVELKQAG